MVQSEFVKCDKVEIWNEESLGTLASDHLFPKPAPFLFYIIFTLFLHNLAIIFTLASDHLFPKPAHVTITFYISSFLILFQIGQRENVYDLESNQSEIETTVFWWINKVKTKSIGIHTVYHTVCITQ